jgi:hypothetical protein
MRISFFLALMFAVGASACPFCPSAEQTLLVESGQAHFVVYGTLSNAVRDPNEIGRGTTDLNIEAVVKDHEFLKGKKTITLPRYVPPDPKNKIKHLIFFELYQGKIDPYRGIQVDTESKVAEYLKGLYDLKEKPVADRLAYCFKYFDATDWIVSGDAFNEFSSADYKDVRAAAAKMDPVKLMGMLKEPGTSTVRYGLIGMLLGHCGKPEQVEPLISLIDDPKTRSITGLDGLLAGLVMLDRNKGLKYVADIIANPKEEFLVRYAALRTIRFFWEYRTDVLSKEKSIQTIEPLVGQNDIADLVIDDLRKWERWEFVGTLVDLFDKPTHNSSIVQRSIIKFALCAPVGNAKATQFIAKLEKDADQADRLKDLRDLIELEKPRPAPPKEPSQGAKELPKK